MDNKNKGRRGEDAAADYLVSIGLRILNRNYVTDVGELDIVATDESTLIFVEVKARLKNDFGYPAEAVNYHKRRKINQVASQYIKRFRLFGAPVRFDVVEVYLENMSVRHIPNAFDSYLRY